MYGHNSLKEIYKYFESIGIPFAAILAYKSRNTDNTCVYEEKADTFKKQYYELLDFYKSYINSGNKINCFSIMNDISLIKNHKLNNIGCSGGINIFAVTDTGDIFSCEHLAFDVKYAIGNIEHGINRSLLKTMQPDKVETIKECHGCWVRYFCRGGCFSEKILINRQHSSLSSDECEIKRIYWDFILSLYIALEQRAIMVGNKSSREKEQNVDHFILVRLTFLNIRVNFDAQANIADDGDRPHRQRLSRPL